MNFFSPLYVYKTKKKFSVIAAGVMKNKVVIRKKRKRINQRKQKGIMRNGIIKLTKSQTNL